MTEYTPIFSIAEVFPINSFPVDRRGIFLSICPPNHQFFKCGIIKIDDDNSSM